MPDRKPVAVEARSIVSGRNLEPYIQLFIVYDDGSDAPVTQWDMKDAWHHVACVTQAIEAAASDSFLVSFLMEKTGLPAEKAAMVLDDFRKWREQRRPPERTM